MIVRVIARGGATSATLRCDAVLVLLSSEFMRERLATLASFMHEDWLVAR